MSPCLLPPPRAAPSPPPPPPPARTRPSRSRPRTPSPSSPSSKRPRHHSPPRPPSSPIPSSATTTLSSCSSRLSPLPPRAKPARQLPDEVLVSIFRFVHSASALARLRLVCRQWTRVIDNTPYVWRLVSFKNATFAARVVAAPHGALALGNRPGHAAVTLAARSGNEWARFLKRTVFDRQTLRVVTAPQPVASLLVAGARTLDARPFPPWLGDHPPEFDGAWIAVHAARRALDLDSGVARADTVAAAQMLRDVHEGAAEGDRGGELAQLPRGAMVGLIHVRDAFKVQAAPDGAAWIWRIDRAVSLKRPIRCAGFVGLWALSGFLTDLLVNAMHSQ